MLIVYVIALGLMLDRLWSVRSGGHRPTVQPVWVSGPEGVEEKKRMSISLK